MQLPDEDVLKLRTFVELVRKHTEILHAPQLGFLRDFITSFGGVIPPAPSTGKPAAEDKSKGSEKKDEQQPAPEPESEESDVELDTTGVIESDVLVEEGDPFVPGIDVTVSEEDKESADAKKMEAINAFNEGNFEEAVKLYSEAIKINPGQALLYAKRGQCYLKLQKPNACIRDCTVALSQNPDSAAAYKFRGRACRLLGQWLEAAADLRKAVQIDFDEQADEWLKEVTPNARKLEAHQRKYERKRTEKEIEERRERVRKAKEEHAKAAAGTSENVFDQEPSPSATGQVPPGIPPEMLSLLSDPEVQEAFKDPTVVSAFSDIMANPLNLQKHLGNPKVLALMQKIYAKQGGASGIGSFPGFPPTAGGGPTCA